jgi:hypothetical protein
MHADWLADFGRRRWRRITGLKQRVWISFG